MMRWNEDSFGHLNSWWVGAGMMIFCLLILGFGVWVVIRILEGNRIQKSRKVEVSTESPRIILDRRLAAGEIDTAHYSEVRELLE